MKKTISIIFLLFTCALTSIGQINEVEEYVEKGVALYDAGKYNQAIEQFKKALKIEKNSPAANYEISYTYFALKEYEKVIEHSDKVIDVNSKYVAQAYMMKGSALDMLGKPKEAIKIYKAAIRKFPGDHLLHYNLALTSYNQNEIKDAQKALIEGLTISPGHASSHLLLGYVMSAQEKRVQSLLAFYNFLLLDPKSNRAKTALKTLESLQKKGVRKENPQNITITVSSDKASDEFSAAELMISMLEASKNLEDNKNKTPYELFAENTDSFFAILGELKKEEKGFWWNFYVDFFYDMHEKKHVEAFSYYISQSKEDEIILTWLKENKEKVDAMLTWFSDYRRKS